MPVVRLKTGWYKIVEVFTLNEAQKAKAMKPKLYLEEGDYRYLLDAKGARWFKLPYPDPDTGGVIFVHLNKLEETAPVCRCPLYRFPHRRSAGCRGSYGKK